MMSWYPLRTLTIFLAIYFLHWFSLVKTSGINVPRSLLGDSSSSGTVKDPHHCHANRIHRRVLASSDSQNGNAAFNVLHYGAKGDGVTDDTNVRQYVYTYYLRFKFYQEPALKPSDAFPESSFGVNRLNSLQAFASAWAAACKVEDSTMLVPSGSVFLVKAISFSGRGCMPNMLFQLDGKLIAPNNFKSWKSGILKWIEFTKLKGITVQGGGTIDGQGSIWWPTSKTKPTALRFYGSTNVTVTGITIQNSPQTHLKFDNCISVEVFNLDIASPGDSPNTDGFHLQNSQNVTIHDTSLACGDDCISIQTGCSDVYIHDISCGPGHGISIGGLGEGNTRACVSNITVRSAFLQNTSHGVRIKTWQGGSGAVQNILFSKIRVSNVQIPLKIDQFYCSKNSCANKTSAVAVAGINYEFIAGTYTEKPVHFACSDSLACSGISLSTVSLVAAQGVRRYSQPFCWNAFGELRTATVPSIDCLKTNRSAVNGSKASSNYSC